MSDQWRLGKHRGKPVAIKGRGATKRRVRIDPTPTQSAESIVRQLNIEAERIKLPALLSVSQLYGLYEKERAGKVDNHTRIREVGRTIQPIWGHMTADEITPVEVERFVTFRRRQGCSDSTIRQELAYVTAAFNMAMRARIISEVPAIAKPAPSRPRERFLERDELVRLIDAAIAPHIKLFVILAITTAGRPKHILELTWDRVDMRNRVINLDNPSRDRTRKGQIGRAHV
jgi:integrase